MSYSLHWNWASVYEGNANASYILVTAPFLGPTPSASKETSVVHAPVVPEASGGPTDGCWDHGIAERSSEVCFTS